MQQTLPARHATQPFIPAHLLKREGQLARLALFFMALVWAPAAAMAALLLTHMRPWWTPAGVLALALLIPLGAHLFRGLTRREALWQAGVVIAALLVSAAFSLVFYDTATDGRWYHADAILALLHGVNPIREVIPAADPVWSNHYPKATWYFAALVIHWLRAYQIGKIYQYLLMLACGAYAADFFQRMGLGRAATAVLAVATALSPVAALEIATYYVDGALGSLVMLAILAAVNLAARPALRDYAVFAMAGSLAMAIKFTGIPYVALAGAVPVALHLLRPGRRLAHLRADLACGVVTAALGVLLLGYNPYITHLRQGLHPFYPLMGAGKLDIMTPNTPPNLLNHGYNRVDKLALSFLARTQAQTAAPVRLKLPFTFDKQELMNLGTPSIRVAGWGVLFSGEMLAALCVFLVGRGWQGPRAPLLVAALILVTTLVNPECFVGRYTPQFALMPVFLMAPVLLRAGKYARRAAWTVCLLALLNSSLCAAGGLGASWIKSRKLDRAFAGVARVAGPGEYWAYNPPGVSIHYDQFSGHAGVVICAQLNERSPLPAGGYPLTVNMRGATEAVLYKRSCAAGPPF